MAGKNIIPQQYSHENVVSRFIARLQKPKDAGMLLGIGSYGPTAGPEHRLLARAARRMKQAVAEQLPLTEKRMEALRQLGY